MFKKKEKIPKTSKKQKIKIPKIKRAKRKLTQTLAFKLEISIFILLFFFFSALVFVLGVSITKDSVKSYSELSSIIAERSSSTLTYWLDGYFKDLRVFTKSEVFLNGDIEADAEFLLENSSLIGEDFEYMGVAGMNGILYTSEGHEMSCKGSQYFKEIIEKGHPTCITDPEVTFTSDSTVFYVAVPIINRMGILYGLFMGALDIQRVQYEVEQIIVGDEGFAFILDGNGTTIAHPDSEKIMKNFVNFEDSESGMEGYKDISKAMLMGQTGNGKIIDHNTNDSQYIYYTSIYGTPWSLGLAITATKVLESARGNRINIALCSLVIALLLIIFIAIYMPILLKPLLLLNDSINDIASGDADLTKRLEIKSRDEIGGVVQGFNLFIENLRTIIAQIKDSKATLQSVDTEMQETTRKTGNSITEIASNISNVILQVDSQSTSVDETVGAVTQIAKSIENLNLLIENQASGVNQASAAVEEMLGNITSVSKSTRQMAKAFHQLESFTKTGIEKQDSVNEQLGEIQEQSLTLFQANKTISKIASETNLLAMNAAIEAAHAGAAGQGFSVVADEIRNLSETSAAQSKTIGAELKKIQESIETVVASSSDAKKAFASVSENIQETDQLVRQIQNAMEESEIGSHQITDALKMMNDSTTEVKTSSSEMSAGNQAILTEVKQLQNATEAIKESVNRISSDADTIDSNGATLTQISETMKKSIDQIGSQIDLFKV